jgi:UDP-N-acetylmuramoyl-L-alanyl-D-glutamate--2,6-diaminopimelate ligase
VPGIEVPNLRATAGIIADRFFGAPSRALAVVGVTGTNGKTSVTHLVAQALAATGQPCGLVGTLGYGMPPKLERARHTTPDAVTVHQLLAAMLDQGARAAAVEVSSHALAQARVSGVSFRTAVFTNLTHDHLDYHADFNEYGALKASLFSTPGLGAAVVFTDDAFGRELLRRIAPGIPATAVGTSAGDPRPRDCASRFVEITHVAFNAPGLELRLVTHEGVIEFESRLLGRFNAINLALAAGVLLDLGMPPTAVADSLGAARTVPGRMEAFGGTDSSPLVIVDYAHTPDALEQVLRASREHVRAGLWCVFGCGGDRDKAKRSLMASVAAAWADHIVVTDDNPRNEDADAIVSDIVAGFPDRARWTVQRARAIAIADAIAAAGPDDVVVIAGKGHEDYQIVGSRMEPFSDRDAVTGLLAGALR